MEYLYLIIRYIDVSTEYFRSIVNDPWDPKLLLFTSVSGILLFMVSSRLWTPFQKWGRRLGIIFTTIGLGSILIAIVFGMDLQFTFPEESLSPLSKTAADKYLTKESGGSWYKTRVAMSEPLRDGNHQQPIKKTQPPKDSSASKWHEIRKWRGTGPKQTETFKIPSHLWMIDWNTLPTEGSPGSFSIKVYSAEGKFIGSAAKTKGQDIDSAFMSKSGDYYLIIETNQKYTISVKAHQK